LIGKHIHLCMSKVEHIWGGEYKRNEAGQASPERRRARSLL
jgi:hypothetical protein